MKNYFNQLSIREQQIELGKCRLMKRSEFANGVNKLFIDNAYNLYEGIILLFAHFGISILKLLISSHL